MNRTLIVYLDVDVDELPALLHPEDVAETVLDSGYVQLNHPGVDAVDQTIRWGLQYCGNQVTFLKAEWKDKMI